MARPQKCGVDYFPLDVVMNDAVRLLEAEFGLTGFGILIKLYQRIYRDQGYYCAWNEEVALLFASDCKVGYNVVSEVLRALFKRGILDQSLYEQYGVLTSEGIQKRYLEMVKRRQDVRLDPRYALLLPIKNPVNVDINGVNADNNAGNVDGGTQRKGKENKNISINHHSAREEAKLRYMGGALGKGVVLLNTDQLDALLEDLSIEEFDKYVTIVADEELKGHHYRKPHYRAIMDMVEQDRRIGGVAG